MGKLAEKAEAKAAKDALKAAKKAAKADAKAAKQEVGVSACLYSLERPCSITSAGVSSTVVA